MIVGLVYGTSDAKLYSVEKTPKPKRGTFFGKFRTIKI